MPFLGSVYQIFGLYPEIYHAMISIEIQEEELRNAHVEKSNVEIEMED
ncbi:phosphonate ABC transporter permease [Bacillus pseudomycoides]|nr:phosphonate ABC transporter permease [Bacillus pseudomycoides]PED05216.1 phosphonate ABC transporter permease [Bacillus pseudomycoides]PEI99720.1 phosphonate ABC transporter permease [Bacillus pseudomycoides]PEK23619.1 phosphonate ABC transporter permease [Bacillus pseudomycoides]PEM76798.1 phosphonate ABC transporter permease [Bacillus pseudomycoides]PEO11050.1 phosphonate ABC transporter permease [Bacillus pseudomycoides]